MHRPQRPTETLVLVLAGTLLATSSWNPASAQCVPRQKLSPVDARFDSRLGTAVAIDGDLAVVGASVDHAGTIDDCGSAFVFRHDGTSWVEEAKLFASDAAPGDRFGISVAVSGDVVLVGAVWNDDAGANSGSAYVFRHDGSTWLEEAKLVASDAAGGHEFGEVALDGDLALIGAPKAADSRGVVYTFRYDGLDWQEVTKIDSPDSTIWFGNALALSSLVAVVGTYRDENAGPDTGAAYVFSFDGIAWTQEAKLTASDATSMSRFGASVSLKGDEMLIGAPQTANLVDRPGAAYVFRFDGADWVEEAKLSASDGTDDDDFGGSVGISGDSIVVGAVRQNVDAMTNAGSAYFFRYDGAHWQEQTSLQPEVPQPNGYYGGAVAVEQDRVLVGSWVMTEAYAYELGGISFATANNYGEGWAGTNGVPSLTSEKPILGTTIDLEIENSSGVPSACLLLMGSVSTSQSTRWDGTLLVRQIETSLTKPVWAPLPPGVTTLPLSIPNDSSLTGTSTYLQVLQLDVGATKGVSFTKGLALTYGDC